MTPIQRQGISYNFILFQVEIEHGLKFRGADESLLTPTAGLMICMLKSEVRTESFQVGFNISRLKCVTMRLNDTSRLRRVFISI